MKLDLDELERDAIGAGSCYDGINPDEALLLIRIARAAVAWRDGDSHAPKSELQVDHIKPFFRGERSTNTAIICQTCNARFHTKPHAPSSAASTR